MTSRSATAFALALIGVFGLVYVVLAYAALDAFPFSGDEYSLALQGELFAKGLVKVAAPPHAEWLRVDHVVIDAFVRSKYPPGAPALLSLGARYGVAWLVQPIESVAVLALVWHSVRRLYGAGPALVALIALGAAPLFMIDAASFYAHAPTLLCLAVAFAAVTAWSIRARDGWLVVAGLAIGAAFLVRPVDAILFGVAMLAFRSPRAVVIPAIAALPFVAVNFWYQAAAFGSPWTDGYHAYEPTFTALYGASTAAHPISWRHLIDPVQWWNHVDIFGQMCLQWTIPGTVIAAWFGATEIDRSDAAARMRTFAVVLCAVFAVALLPMISDPDDGPHPRYLSVTLIPLALLAAAGYDSLRAAIRERFGMGVQRTAIALAVLFGFAQLGSYLQDRIPKQWKREGLYAAVDRAYLTLDAVVIVRAQYPSRYARNGPLFDGVLYLSPPPTTTAAEIAAAYPGREVYEAHEGTPWTLEPVRR